MPACLPYANIIAHIPAGAIDETKGEVTKPYQLIAPARFSDNANTLVNITPLTTALAKGIRRQQTLTEAFLSCEELQGSSEQTQQQLTVKRKVQIIDAINTLESRYGLLKEQIDADYIANQDQTGETLALDFSKRQQASYINKSDFAGANFGTRDIITEYTRFPLISLNAAVAEINMYSGYTFWDDDGYSAEWLKVEEEESYGEQYAFYSSRNTPWQEGTIQKSSHIHLDGDTSGTWYAYLDTNSGSYFCSKDEKVAITEGGVTYSLSNSVMIEEKVQDVDISEMYPWEIERAVIFYENRRLEACSDRMDRTDFSNSQHTYGVEYEKEGVQYNISFVTLDGHNNEELLAEWVNLATKEQLLNFDELIQYIQTQPYAFDASIDGNIDPDKQHWSKHAVEYDGDRYIVTDISPLAGHRTTHDTAEGTILTECSADGLVWEACDS